VRLAAGDDAHARLRRSDDLAIERIHLRERAHRVELGEQALLDGQRGQVGPAVVQAVRRRLQARRRAHGVGVGPAGHARGHRVEVDRAAALDHFGQGREADPVAREARQRPAVEAELQVLGDAGRRHDGHHPGLHRDVALVRHRRRHTAVVVARHHQHATQRRRAVSVAVLQRVGRAVDARALAVPHRKHAVGGALGVALHALRAQHGGGAELFVHGGQEAHAGGGQRLLCLPGLLVDHAQRRPAVAADEAGGRQPGGLVARRLHQRQPDQRLRAGEEDAPARGEQAVGEGVVLEDGGGHGATLRSNGWRGL
jgi:hypothetical protein